MSESRGYDKHTGKVECLNKKRNLWRLRGKAAKRPIRKGKKMATFSEAMNAVKQGKKIQRSLWNGVGLTVQMMGNPAPMTLRYLYIEYPAAHPTKPGMKAPWVASQEDMMTDDWIIIELPR